MVTMAVSVQSTDLIVTAQDGQYLVEASGPRAEDWPDTQDGLTTGGENRAAILAGADWGPVRVTVQLLPAPPELQTDGWEMVVDRDIVNTGSYIGIRSLYQDEPIFESEPAPGRYRLRVHVRGRADAAAVGDVEAPVEDHLLQLWPTRVPQPASVLLGPDKAAADRL